MNENRFLALEALRVVCGKKDRVCSECGEHEIPCPGCDYKAFQAYLDKKQSKKLAKRIAFYRMLIRLAKKDGYVETDKPTDKESKCTAQVIRPTDKGSEITGFLDLTELLFKKYKLTWSLVLTPFILWFLREIVIILA